MDFLEFKKIFQAHVKELVSGTTTLFLTSVSKDALWDAYLNNFPEADGVRQSFNCNCCKQFIKNWGNLVAIKNNQLVTIWDFQTGDRMYQRVVNALHKLVVSAPVRDVFVTNHAKLGTDWNYDLRPDSPHTKWDHFYYELPKSFVSRSRETLESQMSELRQAKAVFKRSLEELTIESTETVLDLIAQGSLYRGEEFKGMLQTFLKYQKEFTSLPAEQKDNYCWATFSGAGAVARMRNTAIGTLLIDISADVDLDEAVRKFESVMAPSNYRRPTPIISKKMIEQAERTIAELGLTDSLARRYAIPSDVPVDNTLFVNRNRKKLGDVFGELKEDLPINPRNLKKVEEVKLTEFLKVVSTAKSIRLLLENQHERNLVSLIAPEDKEAPSLLKWENNFSWCYGNGMADSIREKVKRAGGQVEGLLRISLAWFTESDLDLHVEEPGYGGEHIFFGNPQSRASGALDVDMNAGWQRSRTPVENIIYPYGSNPLEGEYEVFVHNYTDREPTSEFTVEIEFGGEVFTYTYSKPIRGGERVTVAKFDYSRREGIKFKSAIESKLSSREMWNLKTNKFHNVSMVMYSPNYWQEAGIGNKHVFFMLDGCKNSEPARGIFNEFIKEELHRQHKRVFEALANKMKVEPSDQQLSGVGFSTTSEGEFYCEVESSFTRTLKVVI